MDDTALQGVLDIVLKQHFHLLRSLMQTESPRLTQDELASASIAEFNVDILVLLHSSATEVDKCHVCL